jgi:hypothetical protein
VRANSGWKNARFFRNAAGEILVCPGAQGDDCGNVYAIYEPADGGYAEGNVIVCTK